MRSRALWLLLASSTPLALGLFAPTPARSQAKAKAKPGETYVKVVLPAITKHCSGCHQGAKPAGGVDLAKYKSYESILKDPDVWDRVARQMRTGSMPPPGSPAPGEALKAQIVDWIHTTLAENCKSPDAGRVTIRRLNRTEYDNTIRDLFGLDLKPSADFPSDDVGYGFDNIGDVLSLSPLLLEKYLAAAEAVVAQAIALPGKRTWTMEPDRVRIERDGVSVGDGGDLRFTSNGLVTAEFAPPMPGAYVVRIRAWGQQAGPEFCRMQVFVDGKPLGQAIEVAARRGRPETYEAPVTFGNAKVRVGVAFTNDYYRPNDPDPAQRDRNLFVENVEIVGPLGEVRLPESHRRIVIATPEGEDWSPALRAVVGAFLARAYRRPAKPDEIARVVDIGLRAKKSGEPYEKGVRLALTAALVSPHFLFRVEDTKEGPLTGYEVASRLSYFLWSSMPDDELFRLAAKGDLAKPDIVRKQVARMLADPKADALAENLGGQWLQLRKLDLVTPDPKLFPGFDAELREAMRQETILFFRHVQRENRSVIEFLDSRETFLNERLAKHYGIEGVVGNAFRKVALPGDRRGGLVTQASMLTVTSNPTRTSPVKRGKWVLENILGTPPPPPPPGADSLEGDDQPLTGKTLRARLEEHRRNPDCASCHNRMDPIGLGLENFDAVGAWRDRDGGEPIDASGALPDGTAFNGPSSLRAYLVGRKDLFIRALAERLLIYAIGRGLTFADQCAVDDIVKHARAGQVKFVAMIQAVASSDPFLKRGRASHLQP